MSQTKSLIKEPLTDLEKIIADYLAKICEVPGCLAQLHKEHAEAIIRLIDTKGYKITKKAGEIVE